MPLDCTIEYIWHGASRGGTLRARHVHSDFTIERDIGFDDQTVHRRELAELFRRKIAEVYPAEDFTIERLYLGRGQGSVLRIIHKPSGAHVEGHVSASGGSETTLMRALWHDLFQQVQSSKGS